MKPLSALIVDDEAPARRELAFLLRAHPDIEVVAQVGKLAQAAAALAAHRPAVVFLDIHLMGESGFDFIPKIPPATRVVFVTADDTAAIRAFRVNALDYLLKPIDPAALAEAVARLTAWHDTATAVPVAPGAVLPDDRLLLRTSDAQRLVRVEELIALEADGAYSRVHLADGNRLYLLRSLKQWEDLLPAGAFVRIHRNTIVNLARIACVTREGQVELTPGPLVFEASRRLLPDLRARLPGGG